MLEAEWAQEAEEKRAHLEIEEERAKEGADVMKKYLGAWDAKFLDLENMEKERKKRFGPEPATVKGKGKLDDEGKKPVEEGWANDVYKMLNPDDDDHDALR